MNVTTATWFKPVMTLVAAALISLIVVATEKPPERVSVVDEGTLVSIFTVEKATRQLHVSAKGKVVPAVQVSVRPEVGGKVVWMNPDFLPGGILAQGDKLFTIDATDYQQGVSVASAALADAEARLALERGRQEIAQKEWALFENDPAVAGVNSALALRQPQLRSAEAAVAAAEARLEQERLRLQRTAVTAEFNAVVRRKAVDIGQIVGPQTEAALIAGTDTAWVQAAVPVEQLSAIRFPGSGQSGAAVTIRYDIGANEIVRQGRVIRLFGDLEPAGQMARILIEVDDPLQLDAEGSIGSSSLLFESFVNLLIEGPDVEGLVELPRAWLHNDDTVYVFADGRLQIRQVEVAWRQPDSVLIAAGLEAGDRVVNSPLATPVEGMKLRLQRNDATASTGTEATP